VNLLFFLNSLSCGGAERVTVELAGHWAAKGWKVTVVTTAPGRRDFFALHPAVRRIALDLDAPGGRFLPGAVNNLQRILALRRVLKEVRPDVALSMVHKPNVLLAFSALGLPGLITVGTEHVHPPMRPLARRWEGLRRRSYGFLSAVAALTPETAAWLRENTRARKVAVIPDPVSWPLDEQPPLVDPAGVLPRGKRVLLSAGRLVRQKGFDLLIVAFARIAPGHPDWVLVILGEGPERLELEQRGKALGLDGRVFLPGRVGNPGRWYSSAHLFVSSSRFEGFGKVLVEAMACGLPAVACDCETGPRDIIRNEVDGVLVPPGDGGALQAALARLMDHDALRTRFGRRAVEARDRFSMEKVAGLWEALFREIRP